jgi:hypothetical protein
MAAAPQRALFARALGRRLMSVDADLRVVVSRRLPEVTEPPNLACSLNEVEGRRMMIPLKFPAARLPSPHCRARAFANGYASINCHRIKSPAAV